MVVSSSGPKATRTDLVGRRGSGAPLVAGCWEVSSISAVGSLMLYVRSWCYSKGGASKAAGVGSRQLKSASNLQPLSLSGLIRLNQAQIGLAVQVPG